MLSYLQVEWVLQEGCVIIRAHSRTSGSVGWAWGQAFSFSSRSLGSQCNQSEDHSLRITALKDPRRCPFAFIVFEFSSYLWRTSEMALTPLLGSAGPDRHMMHRHIHRQVPHMRTKSLKKEKATWDQQSPLSSWPQRQCVGSSPLGACGAHPCSQGLLVCCRSHRLHFPPWPIWSLCVLIYSFRRQ